MNIRLNFTLLLLALLLPASATATPPSSDVSHDTYDFYVDGIYYDIIGNEASVTCKDLSVSNSGVFGIISDYRGNVVIPSTVTHNGTTYPVTSIGFSAFYDCDSLTSVSIPNSVTSIDQWAFYRCRALSSVSIPNSVISIGQEAFYRTPWFDNQPDGLVYAGLVAYKYKGIMPEGTSIAIKEGTLGIANSAFIGCRGLTNVTIPNSVTSIGEWAFYCCSGLTNVTIPNSVTSIGDCAFFICSGLQSVELPGSLVNIGRSAFSDCPDISIVMLLYPTPPLCPANATTFDNHVFNDAKLYVPKKSVALYQASDVWGQFTHIIGVNISN